MSHPLRICFSLRRLIVRLFCNRLFQATCPFSLWVEWLHRFVISWPVVDAVQNSVSVKIWLAYTPSWENCFSLIESGKKVGKGGFFFLLNVWCFFFFSNTAINWLLQTHLTSCWDDWQPVVHVIANQVTDALEVVVFGAHHSLWIH